MFAIVEIQGSQYKVQKGSHLFVNRLQNEVGDEFVVDKVLLVDDQSEVKLGQPYVEGMSVKAKLIENLKGDKVTVFKKKRRKGYKVKNGHRQALSKITITEIGV